MSIPPNWASVPIREVAEVNPRELNAEPREDELVSFVPMAAVEEESGRLDVSGVRRWQDVKKGYTRFQEGDVLFAKITPCMENGKCAVARGLVGGRGAGSTEFHVIRPLDGIAAKLLFFYLVQREVRRAARMKMKGAAGQLRVPPEFMAELPFVLPPRHEQDRIVAEVEKQLTRLDAAVAALKRVQGNLKRYRAAVLKAACEGRLVPTEAELARREGRPYETGEQLLARILQERRAKWEADQLSKMLAAGKPPKDDCWKRKYKDPAPPDTSNLPNLPGGWTWAAADQLCHQVTDGEHIQPPYQPAGRPMLTATHVRDGYVEYSDFGRITQTAFEAAIKRCAPAKDDILIVSVGATTGRVAVVQQLEPFAIVRSVLLLKPVQPSCSVFSLNWIRSSWCQTWIRRASGASAQAHFYISDAKRMPVPLPPSSEMYRINEVCQQRISVLDNLEESLAAEFSRADRLRQSILKRAFEGKLVPQDPNDEPASVLLQRIRVDRAAATGGQRSTMKRRDKEVAAVGRGR